MTDFYFPATAAGGPPKSLRGALADMPDMHIELFCRNRDHLAHEPFPPPHTGTSVVDNVTVTYLQQPPAMAAGPGIVRLLRIVRGADVIWVNSLHSRMFAFPHLLLLSLRRAPVLISPRGELARAAIVSRRSVLKRSWHAALRWLGADRRVLWIASSPIEAADIKAAFPAAEVFCRPEQSSFTARPLEHKERAGPLRLLFLGRIAPIKGLDIGLGILAAVTSPVRLDIVGPVEDPAHLEELRGIAGKLPSNVEVRWNDPVDTAEVPRLIHECDALFNPTRSESFGHAIAEALALGRPAFIGPDTPWSFAEPSGAVIILDASRLEESAARIDRFARQSPGDVRRGQDAARLVGQRGIDGDGDLRAAVARALVRRRSVSVLPTIRVGQRRESDGVARRSGEIARSEFMIEGQIPSAANWPEE